MTAIIITTCTNRKRHKAIESLYGRNLPIKSQKQLAKLWAEQVTSALGESTIQAQQLYCGRAFTEALKARENLATDLWIISAGLGLVQAEELVPAYNLTLSLDSADSIRKRCTDERFSYADWWRSLALIRENSLTLTKLITQKSADIFCIALSKIYLDLIEDDLLDLSDEDLQRVRLFALLKPEQAHERLRACLMFYDHRLDGPDSEISGTRTDFPQRAMRHFIEQVYTKMPDASAREQAGQIEKLLHKWCLPVNIERQRLSDDEIKKLINHHWDEANSASQMLRLLRDEKKIACEQKRMGELYRQVALHKN